MVIRTGPADFSQRLVTRREHGGMLPDGLSVAHGGIWDITDGVIHRGTDDNGDPIIGVPYATPEESDVFRMLELDWIEPWDRK